MAPMAGGVTAPKPGTTLSCSFLRQRARRCHSSLNQAIADQRPSSGEVPLHRSSSLRICDGNDHEAEPSVKSVAGGTQARGVPEIRLEGTSAYADERRVDLWERDCAIHLERPRHNSAPG